MRQLVLLIFYSLITTVCHGINRIASAADQKLYGDYITPGDLILDTPTKIIGDRRELIYYFIQRQWPLLRDGATIWLDGEKLGFLKDIKFCNSSDPMNSWHIQSVKIKNIPSTRVQFASMLVHGVKNLEVNGESEKFPGLSQWPEERKFLTGAFGFHAISKIQGGHGIHASVLGGGKLVLRGFEIQHGFSGVRINGGEYDIVVESVEISNFYIHDTGDGEGIYLGATHNPPLAKIKNLNVYNGIITRTAAEAVQFQHLAGGTNVRNLTIRAADVRWSNEFRAGQDTGIQWVIASGENRLHHVIVDGFASVGLVAFGSDQLPVGGTSEVSDVLFNDGLDIGMYLHKSGAFGVHWTFNNLYYRNFNDDQDYWKTGKKVRKYIISGRNGTDRYTFKHVIHDGTREKVFQNPNNIEVQKVSSEQLPAPEYVNSGFHEPASRIRQWYPHYAKWLPASKSGSVMIPTTWQSGDILIETKGKYEFYKCIKTHESDGVPPSESKENFIRLTWDARGVRSDQPGWQANTVQSDLPPDDLRLVSGSYWEKLGLGFPERTGNATTRK